MTCDCTMYRHFREWHQAPMTAKLGTRQYTKEYNEKLRLYRKYRKALREFQVLVKRDLEPHETHILPYKNEFVPKLT